MGRGAAGGAGDGEAGAVDGTPDAAASGAAGDGGGGGGRAATLPRALGLTVASAVVWGIAHLRAGRRVAGLLLMGLFLIVLGGAAAFAFTHRHDALQVAVHREWLAWIIGGIVALALVWVAVVIRSYQVVRPRGRPAPARFVAGTLVVVLALGVCAPLAWAARTTYTLRDTIGTIFHGDKVHHPQPVDAEDPWAGRPRLNVLLIGGDGAGDRVGVRTDSMTVASIDTKTGDTVLLSLPRNLQRFPVIPRLRSRWPDGFTGVGDPGDQGLLNELYQDAENDPSLMPGYGKGRRGPEILSEEISYLLQQPIDYYILVNLFGFADIVNAMGGVDVHIAHDIPYGGPEDGSAPTGVLKAGDRHLGGKQALWYGRSRTASSDFVRMGRQKCLLRDIAQQADPEKVLTRFQQLADAAKKTISTNIPADLLPALIKLSSTMKQGAQVTSLMFVPPRFHVYRPDVSAIRKAAARAIADSGSGPTPSVSPSATATGGVSAQSGSRTPAPGASSSPSASASTGGGGESSSTGGGAKDQAASLAQTCGN